MTVDTGAAASRKSKADILLLLYAGTLFTSAFLVFWIQPLFAKMALPLLGGAPAVWNTAMVFFQATLLAAYSYAHLISTRLSPAQQIVTHLGVIALAVIFLPIGLRGDFDPSATPVAELLALLALSVGLPFFAVSATAPLLQRWFSRTGHRDAADPYFLYSASNLGSILALLAFPFLIEPALGLSQQGIFWGVGFAALALLITACGRYVVQPSAADALPAQNDTDNGLETTWQQRLHWIALAFAPSALLLGVTSHITTDLAAIPLLWVVPLSLYLLTYVIVFARRPIIPHIWATKAQPHILVLAFITLFSGALDLTASLLCHLAIFFMLTLACHGELVRRRPDAAKLTEFYIYMSLGGVLGGLFVAVLAPVLFEGVYEYPLAIVAACMLRPGKIAGATLTRILDLALPAAIIGLALGFYALVDAGVGLGEVVWTVILLRIVIGLLVFSGKHRPVRYGLCVAAALFTLGLHSSKGQILFQERSFFGIHRVALNTAGDMRFLSNGTTLHGSQLTSPAEARIPTSYYIREGALGQLFTNLAAENRVPRSVALVGLGAGASLCHARPGQSWHIYEIDPSVVKIARDSGHFTYWKKCLADVNASLHLGDARLALTKAADQQFDLLILDAYSSDAIPVHLLTREALRTYLSKLSPDGVIAFHLTNRHLRLQPVLAALLNDLNLVGRSQTFKPAGAVARYGNEADWIVVARSEKVLAGIADTGSWQPLEQDPDIRPWSDNFSNVVQVLR